MSQNSRIKLGVAVGAILVAGVVTFLYSPLIANTRKTPGAFWYYDMNTGKPFRSKAWVCAPIDAPSGLDKEGKPAGVRAIVMACGGACHGAESHPAWLEKFAPDSKFIGQAYENLGRIDEQDLHGQKLVKTPDSTDWIDAYSEDGQKIQAPPTCPGGETALPCD